MKRFSAEDSGSLRGLLAEEKELLAQINKLTDEQTELLNDGEAEGFDKSLDRRQRLIDKLDGLHQESLMQSYVSGGEKDKEIEVLRKEIRGQIAEIVEKDKINLGKAKELAEQYTAQANKLSKSRKSIGLYNQGAEYGGDYFDKSM